jgi:dipeptidyl aminopeptidase/acylaminoacyl peptidase
MYCRQNGVWPKEVAGIDPHTQADRFKPFEPLRNVTEDSPPTLLVHGTADTDVPYEQSVLMANELSRHGVEHRLITLPGAGHGLAGGDPTLIDRAYDEAFQFVDRHMKAAAGRSGE